jgi:hypothetical protein
VEVEDRHYNVGCRLDVLAVKIVLENMKWKKVAGGKAFLNLERVAVSLRRKRQPSWEKKVFEEKHILVPIERFFGKGEEVKKQIEFTGEWISKKQSVREALYGANRSN